MIPRLRSRLQMPLSVIVCWAFVVFVAVMATVGLSFCGNRMAPVRRGSPTQFWIFAAGVDLENTGRLNAITGGEAYVIDGEWLAYEDRHLHGSFLYAIRIDEVEPLLERVISALEQRMNENDGSLYVEAFRRWKNQGPKERTVISLVEAVREQKHKRLYEKEMRLLSYAISEEQVFWHRWRRQKWYWANFVFEWLFFTGLALFAVWPGIRQRGTVRWSIHAGCLPFLFLLPAWLGYATWTFTSVGPSGGILYPYLLIWWRFEGTNYLDRWLLERTPQVLEALSTPSGPAMVVTGMGMPGPTFAVLSGLGLAACVYTLASLSPVVMKRLRKTNPANHAANC